MPGLSKQYYCFIFPVGEQQGCCVPISLETDVPAAGVLPERPVSWGKIRCFSPERLKIALIPVCSQSEQRGQDPAALAVLPPPHASTLGSPLLQGLNLPSCSPAPWLAAFLPFPGPSPALPRPTPAILGWAASYSRGASGWDAVQGVTLGAGAVGPGELGGLFQPSGSVT